MYDAKRAERAIKFIEMLKLTGDFHGQPFKLMDWQKKIIRDVYGTINERGIRKFRYVYVETAKKNAKSQLGSGVGMFHLFDKREHHGQIYICAGDREQARVDIYEPLVEMIEQEPELLGRVRIVDSQKEIENLETGTILKAISAESYTKHGLNVSLCIFDELHVQPNRGLYDVMMKGAGLARKQPLWWFPTTAGDDPDRLSIAWEVHEKAAGIIKAREKNDHEKDIPTWYPVIYSYEGDDIYNEANWAKANPSLGTTLQIEDLRDLAAEAKLHPADERLFRWLNLNQWTTTKLTSWLPLDLFDATNGDWSRDEMIGEECYLGGDFSTTIDLSAIALIFPPQGMHDDWRVAWECWIPGDTMTERIDIDHVPYDQWAANAWIIPTEGSMIDYTEIEERILEISKLYKIKEMGADKSFASMLLQRLGKKGITCVDIPQRFSELTDPMNQIEVLMGGKRKTQPPDLMTESPEQIKLMELRKKERLTHEPNPVARWCFGNAQVYMNGNGQKKLVKEHHGKSVVRTKRIDPIVAWVNGMARAKFHDNAKSVYDDHGILTF
jgi:phage terminase large subunit-like protein